MNTKEKLEHEVTVDKEIRQYLYKEIKDLKKTLYLIAVHSEDEDARFHAIRVLKNWDDSFN